jgi:hypothetical protein
MDLHDKDLMYELEMCRALLDSERRKTTPNYYIGSSACPRRIEADATVTHQTRR